MPRISRETVSLIKEMARDNQLWGAERIRGELLKLGIRVCKRTIQQSIRQVRATRPRGGQHWTTFLRTHAQDVWACDVLPGDFPLLPFAVRLLPSRIEVTESDPRRRHTIPHRRMDSATIAGGYRLWRETEVAHP